MVISEERIADVEYLKEKATTLRTELEGEAARKVVKQRLEAPAWVQAMGERNMLGDEAKDPKNNGENPKTAITSAQRLPDCTILSESDMDKLAAIKLKDHQEADLAKERKDKAEDEQQAKVLKNQEYKASDTGKADVWINGIDKDVGKPETLQGDLDVSSAVIGITKDEKAEIATQTDALTKLKGQMRKAKKHGRLQMLQNSKENCR